jgi:ribonuclease HII
MASSPTLAEENILRAQGFRVVAGIDEAGRGAWAGPVVAAVVVLPNDAKVCEELRGVNDSKKLSAGQRETQRAKIEAFAWAWSIGCASNDEIDALGILNATRLAMMRAVSSLKISPDALLIDAVKLPALHLHQRAFNFADSISLSVAAASIVAKTERDAIMRNLDARYCFAQHKGYGTQKHRSALGEFGESCWHRRSFKPVRNVRRVE